MGFDLTTMDPARSPFRDKDVTNRNVAVGVVPIVEFSAGQSCNHECDLIAFGNLTERTDGRSYLRLRDASSHDASSQRYCHW